MMDVSLLSDNQKNQILAQRIKQFAAEKFSHEVNKRILEDQLKTALSDEAPELQRHLSDTARAIQVLDQAIATTKAMMVPEPVVPPDSK